MKIYAAFIADFFLISRYQVFSSNALLIVIEYTENHEWNFV